MKNKLFNLFGYVSEFGLYGLLFFIPVSNALVETFVGFILLGFVARKIIKPDFSYLKSWWNIFLAFFFLFNAYSLFSSGPFIHKSLNALFGKWFQYLIIYVIVQDIASDRKIFKRGLFVFIFSAILVAVSGFSQYFFGVEFLRNRGMVAVDGRVNAITSSFTHYNSLGCYLVVVISLLVSLLASGKYRKFLRAFCLIITMIFIVALSFTFSRGSWLAALVSFCFIAFFSKKKVKLLIPVIFLVLFIFSLPLFRERLMFIFRPGGDSDRFRYWLAAWEMIKVHPFLGMGVGTFMANFSTFLPNTNVSYAHNCFLQMWAESGIFALLSFLAFSFSFIYAGIKKFILTQDFVLLGLSTGAVAFLIHSFFDTNLYSLRLVVLFWVWAGLIIARVRLKQ